MTLATIPEAIKDIKAGKFVIVVDDEDRENEGDLVIAAEKVTAESINFMATHGRGLICMPVTGERLDELRIPMMAANNTSKFTTPFSIAVEAREGTTTGISAADRARTVQVIINPETKPEDILMPGHMFPLRARDGGVLVRGGQTEATVDLARLAGLKPAGVLCEIMNADGTMARLPQLEVFAKKHGLIIISVADLIAYRYRHERLVQKVAEAKLPTPFGDFKVIAFKSSVHADEHLAMVMGNVATDEPVLVRVHSQCLTGDVFHSLRCDCGEQIEMSMKKIAEEGRGVEANLSLGFKADHRDYGVGAQILADLGIRRMRLMTNNPKKISGLASYGLEIVEQLPITAEPNRYNRRYLQTKQKKMGHMMEVPD